MSRYLRSLLAAVIIALGIIAPTFSAIAQIPAPVPAEPDAERRTRYTGVSSVTTFNVGFNVYGDGTDYTSWVEVWVNGVQIPAPGNWSMVPVAGSFTTLARPLLAANINIVFAGAQSGTIDIVGARRPRRTSQLGENRGVTARDFNQLTTDLWMTLRETWDKTNDLAGRALLGVPGDNFGTLPPPTTRANQYFCWNSNGAPALCAGTNLITVVQSLAINAQTANYTVSSADCGATVVMSNGLKTLTLPAASSVTTGCEVAVKNNETYPGGRGKILSGFPADFALNNLLYPTQAGRIKSNGSVWLTMEAPGRWKVPAQVTLHVDKTNGSNANDGLASGAGGAIADPMAAWLRQQYQFDNNGTTPIIAMACSQTHTVQLGMGGTPFGTNLVQLSPDGNCSFTWTNAGPCILVSDLAELDLNLTFYGASGSATFSCNQSNASQTGNIYLHNQVVLDLEGTPVWNPAGVNDNFLFCDGPCEYTIANGLTQATGAAGNYAIYMNEGGKGTQSGVISASGSGGLTGVYYLFGPTMLILGTNNGGGWSALGTSKVYGGATLVTNGVTIAGTATKGTGTGRICTSLTDSAC